MLWILSLNKYHIRYAIMHITLFFYCSRFFFCFVCWFEFFFVGSSSINLWVCLGNLCGCCLWWHIHRKNTLLIFRLAFFVGIFKTEKRESMKLMYSCWYLCTNIINEFSSTIRITTLFFSVLLLWILYKSMKWNYIYTVLKVNLFVTSVKHDNKECLHIYLDTYIYIYISVSPSSSYIFFRS